MDSDSQDSECSLIVAEFPFSHKVVPPSRKLDLKALDKDLRDKIENKICEDDLLMWAGIALRH